MPPILMSPEAKKALSSTIRALRARLLDDLHAATEAAYRLSIRARDAGLDEAARARRARLESWLAEQERAQLGARPKGKPARSADDFRREVEKQAAYTLLNRLVLLRLMEAPGPNGAPLRAPAVVTGGWDARAYQDFRALAPALVRGDDTEGYAFLLSLVFDELATDLPGLYGPVGLADLIPLPAATLRHVIEALDAPELATCWTDDMTLGWVYQYWNDPEREALDAKLNAGGKVEPHEIASKTQMFTERYMVDWLLQNSLGPMWLAMCARHGWTAEVVADGTLDRLEARRVAFRAERQAGAVPLTALMPLHTDAERRWAYTLPQPLPADAIARAPDTVRDLKLLDPAVGSGHFLVVALGLLFALYREEARHRGEAGAPEWSERAIVERILSHNLHGIDLDPRAVQIAAAALWLEARQIAPDARPERLNLVASNLALASLPDDDAALVELRREVERETGIPGALTDTLIHALRGADHLGSLLKVDKAVDEAIAMHEAALLSRGGPRQIGLFGDAASQHELLDASPLRLGGFARDPSSGSQTTEEEGSRKAAKAQRGFQAAAAKRSLLDRLDGFLAKHTAGDDLGLRLRGEQLAAGVRFVRLVREGAYDLVVANPPYQGTAKIADGKYIERHYPLGKADLYAAFLLRGLELAREGGVSAMLTMRNWMFIKQYADYRQHLLSNHTLRALGDLSWGAFREMRDNPVAISVVTRGRMDCRALAIAPTDPQERVRTLEEIMRKEAGLVCHTGRHEFDPAALKVVPEWPLVYWWPDAFISRYGKLPRLGQVGPLRQGVGTRDNTRFIRSHWEVRASHVYVARQFGAEREERPNWVPAIMGAAGAAWEDALTSILDWKWNGAAIAHFGRSRYGRGAEFYFVQGLAFTTIGSTFAARVHRFASVFTDAGVSSFPPSARLAVCQVNRSEARRCVEDLNPTVNFKISDISSLPLAPVQDSQRIADTIESAFTIHESRREPSVEFKRPGPSPWRHVQEWAQLAVDRPDGAPLPDYVAEYDPEPPTDHVSFALGVALGRFGPGDQRGGDGILDPAKDDLGHALPAGVLFLDGTLDANDHRDGLGHPAAAPLHAAWAAYGAAIAPKRALREYLSLEFFKDVHRKMYDNRPIHWPLSSAGKTFVVWVNIHRMTAQTLRIVLADSLHPALARLDGELADVRAARDGADAKAARAAEKRYAVVLKGKDELAAFIADVEQCAERGPLPVDGKGIAREVDARYAPDLDDGVMVNSAALWRLLDPQWKDPKKWWSELSSAKGKKDYDWSNLAMRYWPTRVDAKCRLDPSLGVAHGCFWRYHPERAWSWELRLQDEIGPDFKIVEAPYDPWADVGFAFGASAIGHAPFGGPRTGDEGDAPHRAAWLKDHPQEALAAIEKEAIRRMGRGKAKKPIPDLHLLEPGLWSAHPADAWALELRISEKQGTEFHLRAPDEPAARAAYAAAHPGEVTRRQALLATLKPPELSLDDDEEPADPLAPGEDDENDSWH